MEKKKEKFASTDVIGLIDITPNKKYRIVKWSDDDSFWIKDDAGFDLLCLVNQGCMHLGGKEWILTYK